MDRWKTESITFSIYFLCTQQVNEQQLFYIIIPNSIHVFRYQSHKIFAFIPLTTYGIQENNIKIIHPKKRKAPIIPVHLVRITIYCFQNIKSKWKTETLSKLKLDRFKFCDIHSSETFNRWTIMFIPVFSIALNLLTISWTHFTLHIYSAQIFVTKEFLSPLIRKLCKYVRTLKNRSNTIHNLPIEIGLWVDLEAMKFRYIV